MDIQQFTKVLGSPGIVATVAGVVSLIGVALGARLQRRQERQLERDRFRHEIASLAAAERMKVYATLSSKVTVAYRAKQKNTGDQQQLVYEAEDYYYDHRFFFSPTLGDAFNEINRSLHVKAAKREIIEANLNAFLDVVRDDLLLTELSRSVRRSVTRAAT
jgi:hypothetical protein